MTGKSDDDLLWTIVYVSERCPEYFPTQAHLDELARFAAASNTRIGLSGYLLVSGPYFLQRLEGPKGPLCRLYEGIRRDHRHRQVVTIENRPIAARRYGQWSMRTFDLRVGGINGACSMLKALSATVLASVQCVDEPVLKAILTASKDVPPVRLQTTVITVAIGSHLCSTVGGRLIVDNPVFRMFHTNLRRKLTNVNPSVSVRTLGLTLQYILEHPVGGVPHTFLNKVVRVVCEASEAIDSGTPGIPDVRAVVTSGEVDAVVPNLEDPSRRVRILIGGPLDEGVRISSHMWSVHSAVAIESSAGNNLLVEFKTETATVGPDIVELIVERYAPGFPSVTPAPLLCGRSLGEGLLRTSDGALFCLSGSKFDAPVVEFDDMASVQSDLIAYHAHLDVLNLAAGPKGQLYARPLGSSDNSPANVPVGRRPKHGAPPRAKPKAGGDTGSGLGEDMHSQGSSGTTDVSTGSDAPRGNRPEDVNGAAMEDVAQWANTLVKRVVARSRVHGTVDGTLRVGSPSCSTALTTDDGQTVSSQTDANAQLTEADEVFQVIYCSEMVSDLSREEVISVSKRSEAYNAERSISGTLILVRPYFLQYIEGPMRAVRHLFKHDILGDRRHKNIRVIWTGSSPANCRRMQGWTFTDLDSDDTLGVDVGPTRDTMHLITTQAEVLSTWLPPLYRDLLLRGTAPKLGACAQIHRIGMAIELPPGPVAEAVHTVLRTTSSLLLSGAGVTGVWEGVMYMHGFISMSNDFYRVALRTARRLRVRVGVGVGPALITNTTLADGLSNAQQFADLVTLSTAEAAASECLRMARNAGELLVVDATVLPPGTSVSPLVPPDSQRAPEGQRANVTSASSSPTALSSGESPTLEVSASQSPADSSLAPATAPGAPPDPSAPRPAGESKSSGGIIPQVRWSPYPMHPDFMVGILDLSDRADVGTSDASVGPGQ